MTFPVESLAIDSSSPSSARQASRDGGRPRAAHLLLLPLLALLPLALYVFFGYGGNDFSFHITSWLELHRAWSAHEWTLGWSAIAQFNFGEPRFTFYPPISMLIGTALSFLLPMRLVPGAVVWLILTCAGLAMYAASERFLAQRHRLSAAILYMLNPYLLICILVRFDVAEAWVQALLPITFLYFYRATVERHSRSTVVFGVLLALGWLTDIPEAVIIFYVLGFVALVLAIHGRSRQPLLAFAFTEVLSVLLAGFRLVPTLLEKRWIHADALLEFHFQDFMQLIAVPHPYFLVVSCALYLTASIILLTSALYQCRRQGKMWSTLQLLLLLLAASAIFMQTPMSIILWKVLPQLTFAQFPFRFLAPLSLALPLLLLAEGVNPPTQRFGKIALLLLTILPVVGFLRLLPRDRIVSIDAALVRWQRGTFGTPEYLPVGVPSSLKDREREEKLEGRMEFASSACAPRLVSSLPNEKIIAIGQASTCRLALDTYYYPFWTACTGRGKTLQAFSGSGGLLNLIVPAGTAQVDLRFKPRSTTRALTDAISLTTLILVFAWLSRRPRTATETTSYT